MPNMFQNKKTTLPDISVVHNTAKYGSVYIRKIYPKIGGIYSQNIPQNSGIYSQI